MRTADGRPREARPSSRVALRGCLLAAAEEADAIPLVLEWTGVAVEVLPPAVLAFFLGRSRLVGEEHVVDPGVVESNRLVRPAVVHDERDVRHGVTPVLRLNESVRVVERPARKL